MLLKQQAEQYHQQRRWEFDIWQLSNIKKEKVGASQRTTVECRSCFFWFVNLAELIRSQLNAVRTTVEL